MFDVIIVADRFFDGLPMVALIIDDAKPLLQTIFRLPFFYQRYYERFRWRRA